MCTGSRELSPNIHVLAVFSSVALSLVETRIGRAQLQMVMFLKSRPLVDAAGFFIFMYGAHAQCYSIADEKVMTNEAAGSRAELPLLIRTPFSTMPRRERSGPNWFRSSRSGSASGSGFGFPFSSARPFSSPARARALERDSRSPLRPFPLRSRKFRPLFHGRRRFFTAHHPVFVALNGRQTSG